MPVPANYVSVAGSERVPIPGAQAVGAADPNESFQVTLFLRPKNPDPTAVPKVDHERLPHNRKYLSLDEWARVYSADSVDIEQIRIFATANNLKVTDVNPLHRSVKLIGSVADFEHAFSVELQRYDYPGGSYRGRVGQIHIPLALHGIVLGVLGLDNRPAAVPHCGLLQASARAHVGSSTPFASPTISPLAGSTLTTPQLAQLYSFPGGNGAGQTIGIIELGGGIQTTDLPAYFKQLNLRQPQVSTVSVDGGKSVPKQNDQSATLEVMLDIEVAGAVASGSNLVVYFAPNTDQSFINAVHTAVFDSLNDPSVISISWGKSEDSWTQMSRNLMDQAFVSAASMGRTVCCASGDNGSSDKITDNLAHVDFPASSPNALACGGSSLTATTLPLAEVSEVAWNNGSGQTTGGGISDAFSVPDYQNAANIPKSANPGGRAGRGVPDVSGHAAAYQIVFFGQTTSAFGTSAVAPLWAGLAALLSDSLGARVGFLNPQIYLHPQALREINNGGNGAYQAGPGWDACTGFGSPNGVALLQALKGFLLNTGTSISQGDAANFRFATGDFNQDGTSDLYCLKVSNTGTNSLEVHILNGADNFQSFLLNTGTPITLADAANFQFVVRDFNRDGIPDLYCLKVNNTVTNSLEVHVLNGADNFQSFLLNSGTPITQADAANFQFTLGDFNQDGISDLYCLKVSNTGTNSLEVHILNGADNFQSFLLNSGTPIVGTDVLNYTFFAAGDFDQDGVSDLYCIKVSDTGTNSLEVHILKGADNFQSFLFHSGTHITQADAANFKFALGDFNRDIRHLPDLYCLKVSNTGTNSLEVHILDGAAL